MGVDRMMTRTATLIRRVPTGEKDRYGNATTKPVEEVVRCALQQRQRKEHEEGGEISDTLWDLFLPFGTDVGTGAAIRVDGEQYELVGEPWDACEGSRSMWHVAATVRRTSGTS